MPDVEITPYVYEFLSCPRLSGSAKGVGMFLLSLDGPVSVASIAARFADGTEESVRAWLTELREYGFDRYAGIPLDIMVADA